MVHILHNGSEILFDKVKDTCVKKAPRGNLVFETNNKKHSEDEIRDYISKILNIKKSHITILNFFLFELKTVEVNSLIVIIENSTTIQSEKIRTSTKAFFTAGEYEVLPQFKLNKRNNNYLFLAENKTGKHSWVSISYIIKQIGRR